MKDITQSFGTLYHPTIALVVYQNDEINKDIYVEHFDMDKNGNPINAHPLTEREAKELIKALTINIQKEKNQDFLKLKGILPTHILQINPSENGAVLWFTKSMKRQLYFTENLEISNGMAEVPAMLWLANKRSLKIFALSSNRRPTDKTELFYAPFFNVYENGMFVWERLMFIFKTQLRWKNSQRNGKIIFFNSYFSHLMNEHNPINGNCVNLGKALSIMINYFQKKP